MITSVASANGAWRGVMLAALVAVSFALNSALSAVAYAGGSNALTMLLVRAVIALVVLHVVLGLRGVPRILPAPKRYAALALGIPMGVGSYGLLAAIEVLPVGLAVVIFYTYPILVAITGWTTGREVFRLPFAMALGVAFMGVILALDIFGARPNPVGVALAFMAAVMIAAMYTLNDRVRADSDPQPITLHMLATTLVGYTVACAWTGDFALPHTFTAWVAFIAAPFFYTLSVSFLFVIISIIGPVRTALVMNVEPVASVLFGYLLLSQRLNGLQLIGIALVVGTVVWIERSKSSTAET